MFRDEESGASGKYAALPHLSFFFSGKGSPVLSLAKGMGSASRTYAARARVDELPCRPEPQPFKEGA